MVQRVGAWLRQPAVRSFPPAPRSCALSRPRWAQTPLGRSPARPPGGAAAAPI